MIVRAALLTLALTTTAADDPLEGRIPGTPARCISTPHAPTIVGPRTILFREKAWRTWKVEADGVCGRLEATDTLVIKRSGTQLCRGDRFSTASSTRAPSARCRFGLFTPWDLPRL